MNSPISLVTGIPRSGTTLCCKLLNDLSGLVALHEPVQPSSIHSVEPVSALRMKLNAIRESILQGESVESGHQGALTFSNPVGELAIDGVRKVVAKRGAVTVTPAGSSAFQLVVKQNAMFTALLPELLNFYPVYAIIRNPVDVLLSWLTVDLPVNKGRIPGGERFDENLKLSLNSISLRIERQWFIYRWFLMRFVKAMEGGLVIIRYEDIISSQGACLQQYFGSENTRSKQNDILCPPQRKFNDKVYEELFTIKHKIVKYDFSGFYTEHELLNAFKKHYS